MDESLPWIMGKRSLINKQFWSWWNVIAYIIYAYRKRSGPKIDLWVPQAGIGLLTMKMPGQKNKWRCHSKEWIEIE